MKSAERIDLDIKVSLDAETGSVEAVYFRIRKGKVVETREYAKGRAFADYNPKGQLLGVELLAPCTATVLNSITRKEPGPVKKFVRSSIPAQMLVTA